LLKLVIFAVKEIRDDSTSAVSAHLASNALDHVNSICIVDAIEKLVIMPIRVITCNSDHFGKQMLEKGPEFLGPGTTDREGWVDQHQWSQLYNKYSMGEDSAVYVNALTVWYASRRRLCMTVAPLNNFLKAR
jgi:hypothetical protein